MTPDQIRARYVTAIGEAATAKLAAAGLLPVGEDTRQATVSDVEVGGRRTIVWQQQRRWCTPWADL